MQFALKPEVKTKTCDKWEALFGIVLVGGNRIVHGVNPYRALYTIPADIRLAELTNRRATKTLSPPTRKTKRTYLLHATGFVKSGYAKGMGPLEFWQTSTAGRRSAVESGQGNISKSGYLERKMIKALEPMVVNEKNR